MLYTSINNYSKRTIAIPKNHNQHTGYIVFSGLRRSQGVQGLRIIVQSDRTPSYVETRVEVFIETMKVGGVKFLIVFSYYFWSHLNTFDGLLIVCHSSNYPSHHPQPPCPTTIHRTIQNHHNTQEHIKGMNDAQFKTHVKALASKRLEHPKKMGSQNLKYWSEISTQLYNFERGM